MSDTAKIIVSIGLACAIASVGFAVAKHIQNAQVVELNTNNFYLKSNNGLLI